MTTKHLLAGLLASTFALSASAATFSTNFDNQSAGSLASLFSTSDFSFHNGLFAPIQDSEGLDIPGSDQWQIDAANDVSFPLTVIDTDLAGYGVAPSGLNALNGVDQSVLIVFNQLVDISSFSVTLDNSTFGNAFNSPIDFVSGSTVIFTENVDQSVPGHIVNVGAVSGVRAIVLPAGAYYDNLSFDYTASAIPEPSTYAALAGLAGLGLAASRRRRA